MSFDFVFAQALEIALAVFLGLLATVCTLTVFHRLLSPKIQFSKDLRNVFSKKYSRPYYSICIKKTGLFWLIETTVVARLGIRDVRKSGATTWTYYDIPTSYAKSLVYIKGRRFIHLKLHELETLHSEAKSFLKTNTIKARPEVGFRFEDFFMSHEKVTLRVYVLGHDRFTGIKKLYRSHSYKLHNIRDGRWQDLELVKNMDSEYA